MLSALTLHRRLLPLLLLLLLLLLLRCRSKMRQDKNRVLSALTLRRRLLPLLLLLLLPLLLLCYWLGVEASPSRVANTSCQNFPTEAISTFSSGECAPSMVGPKLT